MEHASWVAVDPFDAISPFQESVGPVRAHNYFTHDPALTHL
jgi:hypothetical protein